METNKHESKKLNSSTAARCAEYLAQDVSLVFSRIKARPTELGSRIGFNCPREVACPKVSFPRSVVSLLV